MELEVSVGLMKVSLHTSDRRVSQDLSGSCTKVVVGVYTGVSKFSELGRQVMAWEELIQQISSRCKACAGGQIPASVGSRTCEVCGPGPWAA